MDRVTELIEELSESLEDQQQFQIDQKLEQEQAVSDFYNTPEGKQALGIAGALLTLGIPLPGARAAGASKMYRTAPKKEPLLPTLKKYIEDQKLADQRLMFQQMKLRNEIKNRPPIGSGSRVGTDVAGRTPMPQPKPQLSVVRGPRGPINIDSSKQIPLPLRGGRNTGGLSDTDKAMLEFIKPRPRQE